MIPPSTSNPSRDSARPAARGPSWSRWFAQIPGDLVVLASLIAVQQGMRVLHLILFRSYLAEDTGIAEVLRCMAAGLRFDGRVAVWGVLPGFLAGFLCLLFPWQGAVRKLRLWAASFSVAFVSLIGVVQLGFVAEYHDVFNHFAMLALTDDMGAVLRTVWQEFPLIPILLGLVLLVAAEVWLLRRLLRWQPWRAATLAGWPWWARAVASITFVLILTTAFRGSVGRTAANINDIGISQDEFLNRASLNGSEAMRYTVMQYRRFHGEKGFEAIAGDMTIQEAVALYRPEAAGTRDLVEALTVTAQGPAARRPRHVFLFLLESCDSWPFEERFRSLDLQGEMRRLGEEGVLFVNFLSDSATTEGTFGVLISGLPRCGLLPHQMPAGRHEFPTAPAVLFKELGYRTRAFYAGSSSWQRFAPFCRDQGFDEVYTRSDMPDADGNEWGVRDHELYGFMREILDDDEPSFNFVLNISNHPPFDLDVFEWGFPHRQPPADLADQFGSDPESRLARSLGHHWYADHVLGEFIGWIEENLPGVLVAATGDHYGRNYINDRPNVWQQHTVPLLLYGPEVLEGLHRPEEPVASQRDVVRTLVELAAPAGFRYPAFGSYLLDPERPPVGRGHRYITSPGWFHEVQKKQTYSLPAVTPVETPPEVGPQRKLHRAERAISWWWLRRGTELPE